MAAMCTGPAATRCPDERLAWELYDEHGYRPRELRPCLTAPTNVPTRTERRRRGRPFRPSRTA
jgi:hypothetical protein